METGEGAQTPFAIKIPPAGAVGMRSSTHVDERTSRLRIAVRNQSDSR